jgi:hypothetical protein
MSDETYAGKKAKDLSPQERDQLFAELRKGPPPPPVTLQEKHARDMSDQEKSEWLAEHRRKFR